MESFLEKLDKVTFSVHHAPNVKEGREYQIRLIDKIAGRFDNIQDDSKTHDIVGYGSSMEEAAKTAWQAKFGVDS